MSKEKKPAPKPQTNGNQKPPQPGDKNIRNDSGSERRPPKDKK